MATELGNQGSDSAILSAENEAFPARPEGVKAAVEATIVKSTVP